MRILLLSEGKHELGADREQDPVGSALETIVRRLLDQEIEFERSKFSAKEFGDSLLNVRPGKGHNLIKRALAWIRLAEKRGFDALIAVVDHDGYDDRKPAFDAAQAESAVPLPRALGIAVKTFDAWILADETALSEALGAVVQTQPSPENERDPKTRCQELLVATGVEFSQAAMYLKVAQALRFNTLETRCSTGFKPFAARVRALRQPA